MFTRPRNAKGEIPSDIGQRAAKAAIGAERRQRLWQILLYCMMIGATIAMSTILVRWIDPSVQRTAGIGSMGDTVHPTDCEPELRIHV
jgi:hypothetical protein